VPCVLRSSHADCREEKLIVATCVELLVTGHDLLLAMASALSAAIQTGYFGK